MRHPLEVRPEIDEAASGRLKAVVVASERLAVRAALVDGWPQIVIGPAEGAWALRRAEPGHPGPGRPEAGGDGAGADEPAWALDLLATEERVAVTVRGRWRSAAQVIGLVLRAPGDWLEVTETLSADEGTLAAREAFESRWELRGGDEVREVFSPSLVPEEGDLVGRHMMRAPVLVAESAAIGAALVVDIDLLEKSGALPAALGLVRMPGGGADLVVGLHAQEVRGHVAHRRRPASGDLGAQTISHRYYLGLLSQPRPGQALAAARRKIWSAARAEHRARPLAQTGREYARQIYPATLERLWAGTVLGGRRVGAITSNRSYAGDVWFSSWFNPLRSSYGLYHYGAALGRDEWVEMARDTRALVLSAPLHPMEPDGAGGLFPTVFVFGPDRWVESHHQGGGPGVFHLMDMSWTMYQLLRWHQDLEPDAESVVRAREYARALIGLQRPDGGLPAYVDGDGAPVAALDHAALLADLEGKGGDPYVPDMLRSRWVEQRFVDSAEDAASLLFLASLASLLPAGDSDRERALAAARGVARYLAERVVPEARWTDFEVYYSCSPKSLDFYDHRSGQWPQNTLCMQHGAAGFLELYALTHDRQYLDLAGRAMDRLCLYQQVWSPPWLGLWALGGYGVMNTDGEWNDARQAQFAETHLAFGRVTGEAEHLQRAAAAARAAFTTVFLPVSASRYSGWWRSPPGMAAENHGHGGHDELNGVSGFDWGSGSALATAAYFERQEVPL